MDMKMTRSVRLLTIAILLLALCQDSRAFCNDERLYACKELGITKCVPKTDRCDSADNCSSNPFPIEKPACKQTCNGEHKWCEQQGKCIDNKEVCDCGPEKIYCTTKGTYSCENREGVEESPIFSICQDGTCRGECSVSQSDAGCSQGKFKCGEECTENKDIASFRECGTRCISASDLCLLAATAASDGVVINTTNSNPSSEETVIKMVIIVIVSLIILLVSICVCLKWDDLTNLSNLSHMEKELNTVYTRKLSNPRTLKDLNASKYEELTETIKMNKEKALKDLKKLPKVLKHDDSKVELVPRIDVQNLGKEVHTFISDGCISTEGLLIQPVSVEDHEENKWILAGDGESQRCYCLICVIAGVQNEFTQYLGAAPTKANKKAHLHNYTQLSGEVSAQISRETSAQDKEIQLVEDYYRDPKANSSKNNIETKSDSHDYAENIINKAKQFLDETIMSQSIFSLILYQQNNILAIILKTVKVISKPGSFILDEPKVTRDIYIPLELLDVKQFSHSISIVEEIRSKLSKQNIGLKQISSISSVHVEGILPQNMVDLCETFCALPETECICFHPIVLPQQIIGKIGQESCEDLHLVILHRVLNALTFVLTQFPQGYEIFTTMQQKNNEPVITEKMFKSLRYTSLKAIIYFIRTCPKSIKATLLEIRDKMKEDNETDENKGRVAGLLNAMDKFSFKATLLLQEIVFDGYEQIFSLLGVSHPNWDCIFGALKEQEKILEKLMNKEYSDVSAAVVPEDEELTYLQEYDCLKIEENFKKDVISDEISNCLMVGREFLEDKTRSKKGIAKLFDSTNVDELTALIKKAKGSAEKGKICLFNKFKNTFIQTCVKSLRCSFPKDSIKVMKAMSTMLSPKITDKASISTVYEKPMKELREKFSTMNENKSKANDIDKLKDNFRDKEIRTFSREIVANQSDNIPNVAFLAEVYLNINLESEELQKLLLDIDQVVKTTTPKLNLKEKAQKILISAMRPVMHSVQDVEEKKGGNQREKLIEMDIEAGKVLEGELEQVEQAIEMVEEADTVLILEPDIADECSPKDSKVVKRQGDIQIEVSEENNILANKNINPKVIKKKHSIPKIRYTT